jgi:hypothetical protein
MVLCEGLSNDQIKICFLRDEAVDEVYVVRCKEQRASSGSSQEATCSPERSILAERA